jgi:predicted O-methyltransferase YrrM
MSDEKNPYPHREHTVGVLEYNQLHAIKASIVSVSSMLEYGEAELVYDLPRLAGGGVIANLGHARGGSAMLMASGLRDYNLAGFVYSVDVFNWNMDQYQKEVDRVKENKLSKYIQICNGTTEYWGSVVAELNASFSLMFIDANHRYDGVKQDVEIWSPMVKVGGLLAFHDTNQEDIHRVLREEILDSAKWRERNELHVNRIRVFERV